MNRKLLNIAGVFVAALTSSLALATPGPTTAPVMSSAPRVEVFAFAPVGGTAPGDWTGRGIQEQLQSDISRTGATLVMAPQAAPANDDPIATARQNHAQLAVTGSFQMVGDQIRANGHLIDVASNNTVGGFSATGSQHDLFKIEDALGEQLRMLLPRPVPATEIVQSQTAGSTPDYSASAPTPVYIQPAPVNNYYYDATPSAGYYYPDYSYGYGDAYPFAFGFYGGVGYGYGYGRGYYHGGDHGSYHHGFENHGGFEGHSALRSGGIGVGRPSGGIGHGGFSGGFSGGGHVGGGGGHR